MVQPGDSIVFNASALGLLKQAEENKTKIVRAVVVDKIGRKFLSTPESVAIALNNAVTILK